MTSLGARQRPRHRLAVWGATVAAVTVGLSLLGAGYADRQFKTAPHPGYLPQNLPLYLYSGDFPRSWSRLAHSPLAGHMAEEAAPLLHNIELTLRQWAGIRPTPARWRTWLGAGTAAATDGHDFILCVRPGLVARAISSLSGGDVFFGRGLHQAWRDGFLLLSSSQALLDQSLTAPRFKPEFGDGTAPDALTLQIRTPLTATVTIDPTPDLQVHLNAPIPMPPRSAGLTRWGLPPSAGHPIAVLSMRDIRCAEFLAPYLAESTSTEPFCGILHTLVERWNLAHPAALLASSDLLVSPVSIALYGISSKSGVPLPQCVLATSGTDDILQLLPVSSSQNTTVPYEWNGFRGWMFPLLGDQFSLYALRRDSVQYLATREPLAAMVAAAGQCEFTQVAEDLTLELNWERAAAALSETVTWAATHELLPESSLKDLDSCVLPSLAALSKSGTLHVSGLWKDGKLFCQGVLCRDTRAKGLP